MTFSDVTSHPEVSSSSRGVSPLGSGRISVHAGDHEQDSISSARCVEHTII